MSFWLSWSPAGQFVSGRKNFREVQKSNIGWDSFIPFSEILSRSSQNHLITQRIIMWMFFKNNFHFHLAQFLPFYVLFYSTWAACFLRNNGSISWSTLPCPPKKCQSLYLPNTPMKDTMLLGLLPQGGCQSLWLPLNKPIKIDLGIVIMIGHM